MENKIDFQFLRRTLIFLSVSIILSILFVYSGLEYEQGKYDEYTKIKSSLNNSHRKYKQLVEDMDLLQLYKQTYKDYKKNGLIGGERRLSWIETLESVNDALKLPKLSYALAPQEEFNRPKFSKDSKIQVNSTPMDLTIDLLHEEDLFAVIEGVEGKIDNLFTIDSCKLARKGRAGALLSTKDANLTANCLLRWITVDVQQ